MRIIVLFLLLAACSSGTTPGVQVAVPVENATLEGDALLALLTKVKSAGMRVDEPGLEELLSYSKHSDYLVRVQAIKAIKKSSYHARPEVFSVLVEALRDEHWLVRSFAVRTLAKDPRPEAKDALQRRLEREDNERVRRYLNEALK